MYKIIGADQKEYGPVSADQLRQWITEGRVNAQTSVQAAGETTWKPLFMVPEFAASFPATPPPPLSGGPAFPGGDARGRALQDITGPAIGLIVTASLGHFIRAAANFVEICGLQQGGFEGHVSYVRSKCQRDARGAICQRAGGIYFARHRHLDLSVYTLWRAEDEEAGELRAFHCRNYRGHDSLFFALPFSLLPGWTCPSASGRWWCSTRPEVKASFT